VSTSEQGPRRNRFRRLFERVSTGIAVAAADGRFVEVNPAFCATVGYDPDELRAMDVLSLTHPEDRPDNQRLIAETLAGERDSFTIEKRYLTRDRGSVWVRANVSVLREDGLPPQLVATTEDISHLKQVEARLEQSQELLRIAGDVGRVGGWAIETDPVKLYWSDEVHDLAGYARGDTPTLDEALELYPPGERERMAAAVQACIDDSVPFDVECAFTPRQSEPLWVRVVGEPHRGADGTVERIQGAIIDISEQKRAQQRTAQLADRLTTTMESITDALYTVDTDWRFTYVNRRAAEVLERAGADLIGRDLRTEFPAVVGSPLDDALRLAVAEDRTVTLDAYHYEPLDRYFGITIYPSEQGLAVYFRDVTEQHNDRIELEERGAQLAEQAALLDEAQDAIVVRDLEGRVRFWNRSAERIYGWTAAEAIGRPVQELLRIDPQWYADAVVTLLERGSWVDEVTQTAKDGRSLTVEARWTLLRDGTGRPASVLGIDTDVTERKRIEQQFLRSQRMESIGKLAGGIAHDLNNALVPISTSIEMLRSRETDPLKLHLLEIMATSARRGGDMVDQVLSFARGVDGQREPIAVAEVLEEVRRITAETFPKTITVAAEVAPDLWPVVGDPTQLQQVLVNLCVNARDAMPDGGRLTLRAWNTSHDGAEASAEDDPHVAIRVADTGVGIAPELHERIFEPFFSTKPSGEGTGLGLSTSVVIVESHGGRIGVRSEPGSGTDFEVRLPAVPATTGASRDEEPELRPGAGQLVLFVDDEGAIRDVSRTMLESFGYRVLLAADGQEAARTFAAHERDIAIVVTDLTMPVLDGYALIRTVRERSFAVPIVATSGLNTADASARALDAGADRFLAKPYDTRTLLGAISGSLASGRT
jgi:two-component system, cell cycle sensor histidine kinase and response regulator CckA